MTMKIKIDGMWFSRTNIAYKTKAKADKYAKSRRQKGYWARVIPEAGAYIVYTKKE